MDVKKGFWLFIGGSAVIFTATYIIVFLLIAPSFCIYEGGGFLAGDKALFWANVVTTPWFLYWLFALRAICSSSPKQIKWPEWRIRSDGQTFTLD